MKCKLCGKEISERESHNGEPLVKGRVCSNCNWKVIRERLRRVNQEEKSSTEDIAVVGGGGPVSVADPERDFEEYAKKFKETFILGNTPVRKENPVNNTKVSDGEVVGEIKSYSSDEKAEQVDPKRTATESIVSPEKVIKYFQDRINSELSTFGRVGGRTFNEMDDYGVYAKKNTDGSYTVVSKTVKSSTEGVNYQGLKEIVRLAKEIGLNTLGDLQIFMEDHPGDVLEELKKYREELGEDFYIKEN